MLANLLAAQLYSASVWLSAASQRMMSNCRSLWSVTDVTSPGRLAIADRGLRAINTSVSAVSTELQNSVKRTFTSHVEVNRTFSTLNAVDKYLIRLFADKLERSCWRLLNQHSVVEPTTNRAHSSSPDETLLYNYALLSTPSCCWPRGSDHVLPSSTHQRCHGLRCYIATRRSVRYRVDACMLSTMTSLCRHQPQASYAVWLRCIFLAAC